MTSPSPTAFNLGKYGDTEIGVYTGIPKIEIPLYTIKTKSIEVPLNISYLATGIKARDEASNVGLGWVLNAGGVITQSVLDNDDLRTGYIDMTHGTGGYWEMSILNLINNFPQFSGTSCCADANLDGSDEVFGIYTPYADAVDLQPDIFSYNLLGYTGKFMYDKQTRKIVLLDQQNIEFTISGTSLDATASRDWTVALPDGTKLLLEQSEITEQGTDLRAVSWYLTKIITTNNEEVNFSYTQDASWASLLPSVFEKSYRYDNSGNTVLPSELPPTYQFDYGNNYLPTYLSKITFDNGEIDFLYDGPRDDISNGKRLASVIVKNEIGKIKEFVFDNNSYFYGAGGNHSIYGRGAGAIYPEDFFIYRLKLNGVHEVLSDAKYSFIYNAQPLPFKDSYAVDHWGYNSGRINSSTFVPDIKKVYSNSSIIPEIFDFYNSFSVADRSAVENMAKAATLEEIHYPTGGYTKFDYELHSFSNYPTILPLDVNGNTMGGGLRIARITDHDGKSNTSIKRFRYVKEGSLISSGKLMSPLNYQRKYRYLQRQCGWVIDCVGFTEQRTILDFYIIEGFSHTALSNNAQGQHVGYDRVEVLHGENGENGKEVYVYHNVEDTYYRNSFAMPASIPNTPAPMNGRLVSKSVFNTQNKEVKREEYSFEINNNPTINNGGFLNGMIIFSTQTRNQCISECEQNIAVGYSVYSHRIDLKKKDIFEYSGENASGTRKRIEYIYNSKGLISEEKKTLADGSIETVKFKYPYEYFTFSIPPVSITISDEVLAARDMILMNMIKPFEVVKLKDNNVVSALFTSYKNLNTDPSARALIVPVGQWSFKPLNPGLIPFSENTGSSTFEISKMLLANPLVVIKDNFYSTMPEIVFDLTDDKGNLLQFHNRQNTFNSFIWDYNKSSRTAEVANASQSQIAYTSFEADGKGNWTITGAAVSDPTCPTGTKCFNLSQAGALLSRATLPAGNYIVSYWSKTGNAFTVSGSSSVKQGRTVNGWKYFEHIVSPVSGTVNISGSGYIDEVRLHPVDAQMTTYTFIPLVGISSQCDVNNRITRYFYDTAYRLQYLKDQDGDVIKTYDYQYKGQ